MLAWGAWSSRAIMSSTSRLSELLSTRSTITNSPQTVDKWETTLDPILLYLSLSIDDLVENIVSYKPLGHSQLRVSRDFEEPCDPSASCAQTRSSSPSVSNTATHPPHTNIAEVDTNPQDTLSSQPITKRLLKTYIHDRLEDSPEVRPCDVPDGSITKLRFHVDNLYCLCGFLCFRNYNNITASAKDVFLLPPSKIVQSLGEYATISLCQRGKAVTPLPNIYTVSTWTSSMGTVSPWGERGSTFLSCSTDPHDTHGCMFSSPCPVLRSSPHLSPSALPPTAYPIISALTLIRSSSEATSTTCSLSMRPRSPLPPPDAKARMALWIKPGVPSSPRPGHTLLTGRCPGFTGATPWSMMHACSTCALGAFPIFSQLSLS
mmetsp:Transcript_58546/g.174336  ORF Transcript_58546/g.174336 Transcript_58546/m.174336 type:complete len:376 (-) Transcript_58546:1423-2550(-)